MAPKSTGKQLSPFSLCVVGSPSRQLLAPRDRHPPAVHALHRPTIAPGGGVVTTRAHVHYIVTEHGIAYLHGKTLRERAKALIAIAHPDDRQALEKHAVEVLHLRP